MKHNTDKTVLGFDPGESKGAFSWFQEGNVSTLHAFTTGRWMEDHDDYRELIEEVKPDVIALENIPLIASPSSPVLFISFGRFLDAAESYTREHGGILISAKPATWQRHHGFPTGMTYRERKRFAHRKVCELIPGISIPEDVSDAILIADYGLQKANRMTSQNHE